MIYTLLRWLQEFLFPGSTLSPYIYSDITTKRQIRLLRLVKDAEGSFQRWSLSSFDIENCPPYVAISYTWGEAVDISVDPTASVYRWRSAEYIACDEKSHHKI